MSKVNKAILLTAFITWALTICVMIALISIGQPIFLAGIAGIGLGVLIGLWISNETKGEEK